MDSSKDILVFAAGNPLLDISVDLPNNDLLTKYKLEHGQASLAGEEQLPLYPEIMAMEGRTLIPGGSALNTIRATQFALNGKGATAYMGCIGKDETGATLEKIVKSDGVEACFYHDEATPTGTCGVLVHDKERTLCANLSAALKFPTSHVATTSEVMKRSTILYSTSFFITANHDALIEVGKHALAENKPFGLNLSAVFLLMFNAAQVTEAMEYADFIFCNEDEAAAYAEHVMKNKEASLEEVAKALAVSKKLNDKRQRVAIVTYGSKPVIIATAQAASGEATLETVEVPAIAKEDIVDTNGAGDSFVGGFLAAIAHGKDVITAVKCGIYLSGEVVKRNGCVFPEKYACTF